MHLSSSGNIKYVCHVLDIDDNDLWGRQKNTLYHSEHSGSLSLPWRHTEREWSLWLYTFGFIMFINDVQSTDWNTSNFISTRTWWQTFNKYCYSLFNIQLHENNIPLSHCSRPKTNLRDWFLQRMAFKKFLVLSMCKQDGWYFVDYISK